MSPRCVDIETWRLGMEDACPHVQCAVREREQLAGLEIHVAVHPARCLGGRRQVRDGAQPGKDIINPRALRLERDQ